MEKTLLLTLTASLLMPLTAIHAAESLEQQFQNPPEEAKPSFGPEVRLKPVLPRVFGSKMILQRDREVPVWGWAEPGEEVAVSFAGQVKKTKADAHGKWIVKLGPMPASAESRTMVVKGNNEVRFDDVLVGEVWLASGQSNMYWTWGDILPEQRLQAQAEKDNRLIRSFHVKRVSAESPKSDIDGAWKDCAEMLTNAERFHPSPHSNPLIGEPDNDYRIEDDGVSAVGFFFASKLQKELGVPVAFISSNWGATPIECFIPDEGYQAVGLPLPKPGDRAKTVCNAMILPLAPYALRGAIWYQGESNRGAPDYFQKLQALSAGWSRIFGVKDIPILQAQIAPFLYNGRNPNDSTLCNNIWAAQYRAAREIPGMGVIPLHDTITNLKDIHPPSKQPVGERLAALALKSQYGKDVVATGPSFASASRTGPKVVVAFKDIGQGLATSDGKPPTCFELSADGTNFAPAEAAIIGDTVEVTASSVPEPKFIRMGWTETSLPNLKDKNGWPAFAFAAQFVK
jgi:sialate O-acetylesterase